MDAGRGSESRTTRTPLPESKSNESPPQNDLTHNLRIGKGFQGAVLSSTSPEKVPTIISLLWAVPTWKPRLRAKLDESPLLQDLTRTPFIRVKLRSAILSSIVLEKLPEIMPLPWVLHFNFRYPVDEDVPGQGLMRASLWAEPPHDAKVHPCRRTHVCQTIQLMLDVYRRTHRSNDNPENLGVLHWLHEMQPRKGASFGEAVDIILGYRFHHFTALTCTGDKQGEDLFIQILFQLRAWNILEPAENDETKALDDERMKAIYEDIRKSSIDSRRLKESMDQTSAACTGAARDGRRCPEPQVKNVRKTPYARRSNGSPDSTPTTYTDVTLGDMRRLKAPRGFYNPEKDARNSIFLSQIEYGDADREGRSSLVST